VGVWIPVARDLLKLANEHNGWRDSGG
jgi:hypothetical protein